MPMLLRNLMGSGLPAQMSTVMAGDITDNQTATGTTQATALVTGTAIIRVTTVAAGTGVILNNGIRGDSQLIVNAGVNTLLVYPPVGHSIEGATANAPTSLPAGTWAGFDRITNTGWITTDAPWEVSFKDFGAVGNATGVTGIGNDDTTAIQAAMTAAASGAFTLHGTSGIYRVTTQLNASSNLKLIMDEDCVIFMDNTTLTSGWITHVNYSSGETLSKVTIRGGELRGLLAGASSGSAIRINCDDLILDNILIQYAGRVGMQLLLSGNRGRVSGIRTLNPYIVANGYDGIHFIAGTDWLFSDCHIEADDDCYAVVTGADNLPSFGNTNISNIHFVNCTYTCNRARGFVVTTDGTTASITNVSFTGGGGSAPVDATAAASGMEVSNTGSGTVSGVVVEGVFVDNSTAGTTAGALRINNTGSGILENVSFFGTSVMSPKLEALFITATTVLPKNLRFVGCQFGGPRTTGNRTVSIREGKAISFEACRFTSSTFLNANLVGVGTSATDCPDVHFTNCTFDEIGDTGSVTRYGISWTRCSFGSSRSNVFIPTAGTTLTRAHNIQSNASYIKIDADDCSQVTDTAAPILNAGTFVTITDVKGVNAVGTATGISAAGTTQGTATTLTAKYNSLTTVAANSGVKLITTGQAGEVQTVFNGGANPVKVYPPSSAHINQLSNNIPHLLATNTACTYSWLSTTFITGVLSA